MGLLGDVGQARELFRAAETVSNGVTAAGADQNKWDMQQSTLLMQRHLERSGVGGADVVAAVHALETLLDELVGSSSKSGSGRARLSPDDLVTLAECYHALAALHLRGAGASADSEGSEASAPVFPSNPTGALYYAKHAVGVWRKLLQVLGSHDRATSNSNSEAELLDAIARGSSSPLRNCTQWRVIMGFAHSLELAGLLYELQGDVRRAEYFFTKGMEIGQSQSILTPFLLQLARLECKRRHVDKSQSYLQLLNALPHHRVQDQDNVDSKQGGSAPLIAQQGTVLAQVRTGDILLRTESARQAEQEYSRAQAMMDTLTLRSLNEIDLGFTDGTDRTSTQDERDWIPLTTLRARIEGRKMAACLATLSKQTAAAPAPPASQPKSKRRTTKRASSKTEEELPSVESVGVDLDAFAMQLLELDSTFEMCNSPLNQAKALLWLGQLYLYKAQHEPAAPTKGKAKRGKSSKKVREEEADYHTQAKKVRLCPCACCKIACPHAVPLPFWCRSC